MSEPSTAPTAPTFTLRYKRVNGEDVFEWSLTEGIPILPLIGMMELILSALRNAPLANRLVWQQRIHLEDKEFKRGQES